MSNKQSLITSIADTTRAKQDAFIDIIIRVIKIIIVDIPFNFIKTLLWIVFKLPLLVTYILVRLMCEFSKSFRKLLGGDWVYISDEQGGGWTRIKEYKPNDPSAESYPMNFKSPLE